VVFNDGESMAYDGGRTNGRRIARVWQCPFQAGAWADHPQVSDYLKKAATITHSESVHAGRPNYHEDGHRPLKRDLWASVRYLNESNHSAESSSSAFEAQRQFTLVVI